MIIVTVVAAYWSIIPDVIAIPPGHHHDLRVIMSVPIQTIAGPGSKTVTNKGRERFRQHLVLPLKSTVNSNSNNQTMEWNSGRTRTGRRGIPPLDWQDDEYLIGGTADGICSKVVPYTLNITTPRNID